MEVGQSERGGRYGADVAQVVLLGLMDGRGQVLLQERDSQAPIDPDRWTLPGGGVEPGESDAEAASRELFEETGLRRERSEVRRSQTLVEEGRQARHETPATVRHSQLTGFRDRTSSFLNQRRTREPPPSLVEEGRQARHETRARSASGLNPRIEHQSFCKPL